MLLPLRRGAVTRAPALAGVREEKGQASCRHAGTEEIQEGFAAAAAEIGLVAAAAEIGVATVAAEIGLATAAAETGLATVAAG